MRAAAVDGRLEAIAGPPLIRVMEPTLVTTEVGTHIVAVGVHAPSATNQRLISLAPGWAGVTSDPPQRWFYTPGTAHLLSGTTWWGAGVTTTSGHKGLGSAETSVAALRWQGPFAAVTYGRTLTPSEVLAVARHLAHYLH